MRTGGICIALLAASACTRDFAVPANLRTRPPQLGHFAVAPPFARAGDTLTLSFDVDEDLAAAAATFAGAAAACAIHGLSVACTVTAATAMGEGPHAFDVSATDAARNEAKVSSAATAVLDFTPPVLAVAESPTPAIRGSPATFVVDANEALGAAPTIDAAYLSAPPVCTGAVPGTRFVCTGATVAEGAAVGPASFSAAGVDRAGNTGRSAPGAVNIQNPAQPPPHITIAAVQPSPAAANTPISFTLAANQPLDSCAASVAGQLADCGARPTGATCTCTFTIPTSLAEGDNIILGFGSNVNGTGSGSGGVQIDNTRPLLDTTRLTVTRTPVGANDRVAASAGAAADDDPRGVSYAGRGVKEIRLWASDTAGAPLTVLTPAADGSFAEVELQGTDGTTAATLAPEIVFVSAVDAAGNESLRLAVQSGADTRPTVDDTLAAFVRHPAGQPDGVAGPAGALQSPVCAPLAVRAWDQETGDALLLGEGLAAPDGSFPELSIGSATAAPAELWISAFDKCGSDGIKTLVRLNAGAAPTAAAAAMHIRRRDLTARDGVAGDAGALSRTTCYVTEALVYDKNGTLLARGPSKPDGSFDEVRFGANDASFATLTVHALDKCGLESDDAVPADGLDTGPQIDGALATLVNSTTAAEGSTVSGAAGAVTSPVSVLVQVSVLDPVQAPLAQLTLAADGSFVPQTIGHRVAPRVYLFARDKAGATRTGVVRNVQSALDLSGHAPYQPGVSLYEVSSARSPTLAGPGWGIASAAESSGAREALAATENDSASVVTTAVDAAPLAPAAWSQLPLPNGRGGPALAYDQTRAQLVLFGGTSGADAADTWTYDAGGWKQLSPAHAPPPRHNAMMAWDGAQIILFGGRAGTFASGTRFGDTWAWNGSDWQQLAPAHAPNARELSCIAEAPGGALLFGGYTDAVNLSNETWFWDGADWRHRALSPPLALSPRAGCGLARRSATQVLLFGGDTGAASNDTWSFDLGTGQWTQVATTAAVPAQRSVGLVFDAGRSRVVMAGGSSSALPQTWEFTGSDWQSTAPALEPVGRSRPGLAYDGRQQRVVLFGGSDVNASGLAFRGDLWSWDGAAWTVLADAPTTRLQHAAAWDLGRRTLVTYGGSKTQGVDLDELWEFDGAVWQRRRPVHTLGRIVLGNLAYDAFRGRTVLFGGASNGLRLSETAEWDGSDWTLLQPAARPSVRADGAMAFDAGRGRIVYFGGNTLSPGSPAGDTWEYDGASWTQVATITNPPPPRFGATLAYDAVSSRILLFGGNGGSPTWFNDTWAYDGTDWLRLADGPLVARGYLWFDPFLPGALLSDLGAKTYTPPGSGAFNTGMPARTYGSVVYDPSSRRALAFGGATLVSGNLVNNFSEVWQLAGDWPGASAARWAAQYFSFPVDARASASALSVRYVGTGASVYLWNWDTRAWDALGSATGAPIAVSYAGAAASYVQGGHVWLLAAAPAASTASAASQVQTDYANATVAYTLPP